MIVMEDTCVLSRVMLSASSLLTSRRVFPLLPVQASTKADIPVSVLLFRDDCWERGKKRNRTPGAREFFRAVM